MKTRTILGGFLGTVALGMILVAADPCAARPNNAPQPVRFAKTASYIVQAASLPAAQAAVERVGGGITHELGIIEAVAAQLTPAQVAVLQANHHLVLTPNGSVTVASANGPVQPNVVAHTQANLVQASGITGKGITIAFLDTGWWSQHATRLNTAGQGVVLQGYDAIDNTVGVGAPEDFSGHGTHVLSVATDSAIGEDGGYIGVAPDAARVIVRAFDQNGSGTYANAIRGMNWILNNAATYRIRVVNMSFGATPQSFYWNDPMAQAVMKLWQAGIVVVTSAGNEGPAAQTITVPGNVPYVITVGAMTDSLESFSSTGPTAEGFVKPEFTAPGGGVMGIMPPSSTFAAEHPAARVAADNFGSPYFTMSGTSVSAAVVSGTVALILQADPQLTPDQVKCKLLSSARPAVDGSGNPAFNVFQQGAGQINAYEAVFSQDSNCANAGLNIAADLAGTQHFSGPARENATGNYYIVDQNGIPITGQGYLWNAAKATTEGYLWNAAKATTEGYLWNASKATTEGYLWNASKATTEGYLWNASKATTQGYLWNAAKATTEGYLWNATKATTQGYLWNATKGAP